MTQLAATFPNDDVRCWITVKCSVFFSFSPLCFNYLRKRKRVRKTSHSFYYGKKTVAGPIKLRIVGPVLIGESNKSIKNVSSTNVNSERDRSPVNGEKKDLFFASVS